ncbi:MAG: hypothetical protein IT531_20610 [Burkholderiales bacterium]|nr:hypothetical protein [Burkholderiales bacterium]
MLFMVISTPRPDRPSTMRAVQRDWWQWMRPLEKSGVVKAIYVKVGRGAAVVFDVKSNEELHTLVTQWSEHIPAEFQVLPLAAAQYQEKIARREGKKKHQKDK